MSNTFVLTNISECIVPQSCNGKPRAGIKQKELLRIPHAYIAVEDGIIQDFGSMEDMDSKWKEFPVKDAGNRLVMPGFVDPHTHLVFAGNRAREYVARLTGEDYLSILSSGGGILETVQAVRNASVEELTQNTIHYIHECLCYGTTAFEIKSGYGLDLENEIKMLQAATSALHQCGVCGTRTLLAAHAFPPEYKNDRDGYVELINSEITPAVAQKKLAENIDVFCEKGVFDVQQSSSILECGIKNGLRPKMHVDEFESLGGLSLGAKLKILSADHLMVSDPKEYAAFREAGSIGVVLPGTCLGMVEDEMNRTYARNLMDADIPVAIGTDFNPGTCMCNSMQMMIEIAILVLGFTVEEAINAATVNASFASGLQHCTGMIEKGLRADLLILSIHKLEEFPYRFGLNKVTRLLLNGFDFPC